MNNIFNQYSEALDVTSRMTEDERNQVDKYKKIIARLRTEGDDQGIQDDIREMYRRIKKITDKYTSDDEKKKAAESLTKSSMKRSKKSYDARSERGKGATEKYNAMSDEDKAREAIVGIRNASRDPYAPMLIRKEIRKVQLKNYKDAIEEIVSTYKLERPYNIKSKFNLKEKAGYWGKMDVPAKIKEIYKKYDLGASYI